MGFAVEYFYFFSIGDFSAITGRGIKRGDARASCPASLSQGALWDKINLQFTAEHLTFKFFVFSYIRGYHFDDLSVL